MWENCPECEHWETGITGWQLGVWLPQASTTWWADFSVLFTECRVQSCKAHRFTRPHEALRGLRASGRGFATMVGWKPGQLVAWSCLRTKRTLGIRIQDSLGLSRQSLLSSLLALSANTHRHLPVLWTAVHSCICFPQSC